jgi:hypothetical protein
MRWVCIALFGFLYGHVLTETSRDRRTPDEFDHVLRLGLFRLPIGDIPHLRNLAPTWASYDGLAELGRGLDILLSGLAARLGFPDDVLARAPRPGSTQPNHQNGRNHHVAAVESPQRVRRPEGQHASSAEIS